MEEFLKTNRHWLVAVCTLGVLVLCYSELKRGELASPTEMLREGMLERMMVYEPPVIWGSTDYVAVGKQQAGDVGESSSRSSEILSARHNEGFSQPEAVWERT